MTLRFDELVPAALAGFSALVLAGSHWLQLSDPATTVFVGLLAGATTLYFVNKTKPPTP